MKKRMICCALVLLICMSLGGVAFARQASGYCHISNYGRDVTFNGFSQSAQTEDEIGITLRLMEQRGGSWHEVARASNRDESSSLITASGSKKVTGGYNYKVIGDYTSKKGGVSYSSSNESNIVWIS